MPSTQTVKTTRNKRIRILKKILRIIISNNSIHTS